MKKLYTLVLGMAFATAALSQGTIVSFSIDPPAPTTADYVKIYVDLMFSSGGCDMDNQGHSTTGSNTSAYAHHCIGMLTVICNVTDTFNLGYLPAGSHIFDMTLTSGSGGPPCTPGIVPDDQRNTTFTVSPATGITNLHSNAGLITIYPNPMNAAAIIKIDPAVKMENAELKITDVTGRIVKTMEAIQTNQILLDRDELAEGIYFYQLLQNKEMITSGKLIIK